MRKSAIILRLNCHHPFVLIVAAAMTGCGPTAQNEIERGLAASEAGDNDLAAAYYDAAIQSDPRNAEALALRASIFSADGDSTSAIKMASDAIRLDVTCWRAYLVRGVCYGSEAPEKSLKDLDKAVQLRPDNPQGWTERGYRHQGDGRLTDAINDLTKAIGLQINANGYLHFRRAYANLSLGNSRAALADFDAAVAASGLNKEEIVNAQRQRGILLLSLDREPEAVAAFEAGKKAGGEPTLGDSNLRDYYIKDPKRPKTKLVP